MEIIRGKLPGAKKAVIYGPEGIGKTTFASKFPQPLFIDTEGSTKDMDVARFEAPSSWQMLLDQVRYVHKHPECCRTLVIDTADWAEKLCAEAVCDKAQMDGIEGFGYGKGYVYLAEEFGRLLDLLSDVTSQGIHVVVTAHAQMRKFEQPDEMGAYDRWELKLQKKTAPLLKEWADMLLFANYKTYSVAVDDKGKKRKAQGGRRVMYTQHHPCWDAKNRYGLEDELPFEYSAIAHVISDGTMQKQAEQIAHSDPSAVHPAPSNATVKEEPGPRETKSGTEPKEEAPAPPQEPAKPEPIGEDGKQMSMKLEKELPFPEPDKRIPKALRDLMIANRVDEWEIQNVVVARGYVPADTPVWEYDTVNPGIIDGLLVASWDQVYAAILKAREEEEIPFN